MLIVAITVKIIGLCCEIKKSGIKLSSRAGKRRNKKKNTKEEIEAGGENAGVNEGM